MSKLLRIRNTSVNTLVKFLEAAAATGGSEGETLANFAGMSKRSAQRALSSLEALGLVISSGNDRFEPVSDQLGRGLDSEQGRLRIQKALLDFRPFEVLCEGLALGEDFDTAARKALVLLGIPPDEANRFETLAKWGRHLHVLESDSDGKLRVASELVIESEDDLGRISAQDLESEARSRLYNSRRMTREAHEFIGETERDLLAKALMAFRDDPDTCIDSAGQGLEDFLREVAIDKVTAQEASKCSGPTQLANLLRREDVILPNHANRVAGLSAMRATSAHSKDKTTAAPWSLDEHVAFWTIDGVLLLIRSVYYWVYRGSQIA